MRSNDEISSEVADVYNAAPAGQTEAPTVRFVAFEKILDARAVIGELIALIEKDHPTWADRGNRVPIALIKARMILEEKA